MNGLAMRLSRSYRVRSSIPGEGVKLMGIELGTHDLSIMNCADKSGA
jgi:hypothetical protein